MSGHADTQKLVSDGLEGPTRVTKRGQHWQFLQVVKINTDLGAFFTGYLGKYKPEAEEEVAVPETQDINDETIENRITAKARFFLHEASHLIAYHPVGSLITRRSFCSSFSEVFRSAHSAFFVDAEIQGVEEENQLREAMARFSAISRVRIYLHPSNPNNRDLWKRTDDRLRSLGVTDYHEQYQGKQQTTPLRITQDEEVRAKIAMAEDGYGRAELTGVLDGEEQTLSTDDNPVSATAPGEEETPEMILEHLLAKFTGIISRFR
jgi:hypothetical protein